MDNNTITAFSTILLVLVGIVQIGILIAQRRQSQLQLIEDYRKRWNELKASWGVIIFIGRDQDEYYQVVDQNELKHFAKLKDEANNSTPTIWDLDASRSIFTTLSDICIKIIQNQITVTTGKAGGLKDCEPLKAVYSTDSLTTIRWSTI